MAKNEKEIMEGDYIMSYRNYYDEDYEYSLIEAFNEGYYDAILEAKEKQSLKQRAGEFIANKKELAHARKQKKDIRKQEYARYKLNGGTLSIKDFKNPELLAWEEDRKKNPTMYKTLEQWRAIKTREQQLRKEMRKSKEEQVLKNKAKGDLIQSKSDIIDSQTSVINSKVRQAEANRNLRKAKYGF